MGDNRSAVLPQLPDLQNYADVLEYISSHAQTEAGMRATVEAFAAEGSPLGHFRAAVLAYRMHPRPEADVEDWLRDAYINGDRALQMMAMATMLHLQVNIPFLAGITDTGTSMDAITTLEGLLKKVHELPPESLRLEAELRMTHALFQANITLGDTSSVNELSARLVQIASLFRNSALIDTYRGLRAYALMAGAQYDRSAGLYAQLLSEERPGTARFQNFSALTARALANLGSFPRAIEILEAALLNNPEDPEVRGWLQWMRAMVGVEDIHAPVMLHDDWRERYGWQIEALQAFAAAECEPPLGKMLTTREEHFRNVLRLSERGLKHNRVSSDTLFDRWMRARARLLLGEYGAAAQEVTGLVKPEPEDLLNRALLAALFVDLAMSPLENLPLSITAAEVQLREVFELAQSLAYADANAMAQLITRWHPQVAVYAALMPVPIKEFLPALDLLVRVGPRSTWRGRAVPPKFITHLVRLGFRVPPSPLALGGNMNFQVSRLTTAPEIWGPLVSALPVATALLRGDSVHHTRARTVLLEYGGVPDGAELAVAEVAQAVQAIALERAPIKRLWTALEQL